MEKKIFLGLTIFIILGYFGWYLFVDSVQQRELQLAETELNTIAAKLNKARSAQMNLQSIQKKYEEDQKRLIRERTRFLNKNELSIVTKKLKFFSSKYKIKLLDFSPGLDSYFGVSPEEKIVSLPIDIMVEGYYLNIGKFLEHWKDLPFYMIPNGVELKRADPDDNMLHAIISASLYTWNE